MEFTMRSEGSDRGARKTRLTPGVIRRFGQIALLVALQAILLFASAGRLDWFEGWLYVGLYLFFIALNAALILPKGPDLIEERSRMSIKGWDRLVMALYSVSGLAMLVVAGLDERNHWSPEGSMGVQVLATVFFALGYGLFCWAMVTNAYFSAAIRIQADRGHSVVSRGPYRYVRHPGYLGVIVIALAAPIMLGSWWALVPGCTLIVSVVARTLLEDRTLQDELDGYREYAGQVRYRIFPGVF
jgi:protein-S-isoprenylcysteine O-methyltransferase Ste14